MKKVLTALTCATIVSTAAMADIARIEIGAGAWMQTPEGSISYKSGAISGNDTSKEDDETSGYVWLLVKHPVPIIPNLRLEYVSLDNTGTATGTFEDYTIPTSTTTLLEMTQYDVIPYYNILDNTAWITLDLGIDFKVIDATYTADNVTIGATPGQQYTENSTIVIPMAYARARVEIPTTDFGIETDIKYISFDSNTMYDVRAKVDYTFDITPIIQPAIEVGYRIQKIETDDSIDANINLDYSGLYAGVIFRF